MRIIDWSSDVCPSELFSGRKPSGLCFFHQLALARLKLFAKLLKVDIGLARLGEHAVALLFLFLDVMLDLLLQNQHLGVIIFLIGLGLLKLQNQRLGRIMLDIGLVQIIFLDLAAKRRIENLFLYTGVDIQLEIGSASCRERVCTSV